MNRHTKWHDGTCPRCGQPGRIGVDPDGYTDCQRCRARFAMVSRQHQKRLARAEALATKRAAKPAAENCCAWTCSACGWQRIAEWMENCPHCDAPRQRELHFANASVRGGAAAPYPARGVGTSNQKGPNHEAI
jgi:hypothetical protein